MSNVSISTTIATTDLHPVDDSTRPILGFPLGTALLVLVIFCISGIVSCCYHYEKIRSLRRSSDSNRAAADRTAEPQDADFAAATATNKSAPFHQLFQKQESETLPVLMPGDKFPQVRSVAVREAHHHQDGGNAHENAAGLDGHSFQ